MNRIESVRQDIQSETNVDDRMELIMYALNDTVSPIPEEGNICTFKYFAKTPNIRYDQHPLVAVTDLFEWGFRGINFHHPGISTVYLGRIRNSSIHCSTG